MDAAFTSRDMCCRWWNGCELCITSLETSVRRSGEDRHCLGSKSDWPWLLDTERGIKQQGKHTDFVVLIKLETSISRCIYIYIYIYIYIHIYIYIYLRTVKMKNWCLGFSNNGGSVHYLYFQFSIFLVRDQYLLAFTVWSIISRLVKWIFTSQSVKASSLLIPYTPGAVSGFSHCHSKITTWNRQNHLCRYNTVSYYMNETAGRAATCLWTFTCCKNRLGNLKKTDFTGTFEWKKFVTQNTDNFSSWLIF